MVQKETQEELLTTLQAIQKKLASIESLLQRMPELLAAVFFTMKDEYEAAKWCGKKAKDIWEIAPVNKR